jgi:hypothetical protein
MAEARKQYQKVSQEVEKYERILAKEQGQSQESQERLKQVQIEVTTKKQQKLELEQYINRVAAIQTRVAV